MRLRLRTAATFGLAFLWWRATPVAAQTNNNTIYACVDRDGDVRIVDPTERCRHHETRVRWNVVGPQGPAGPQGPQGAAGPQGPIGPTGQLGQTGAIGPQGSKGDTGAQGPQGLQGLAGLQGPQGSTGKTGATGPQGLTGPQGPQGDGFAHRGAYDANQTYAPRDVVVYEGSAYVATAPTVGAPGADPSWTLFVAKGDAGPAGATGPTGPTGPAGPQGLKGDTGATGAQGIQGPAGQNGGSVTVAAAPAITCPSGGAAITDAFSRTQYVCDGRTGAQGPQGAQGPAGRTTVLARTWINSTGFSFPAAGCCNTDWLNGPSLTVPNSTSLGTTTGGPLLIEATIPISSPQAANMSCQPNIDDHWAGAPMGSAWSDYFFQFSSTATQMNVTISRVYPAPPPGNHTFSLACASNGVISLITRGVVSYSVFELH